MTTEASFYAPKLGHRQPSHHHPIPALRYRRWTSWGGSVLVHGIIAAVLIFRGVPPTLPWPSSQQPSPGVLKARLFPSSRVPREPRPAPTQTPLPVPTLDAAGPEPTAPGVQAITTNTSPLPASGAAKLPSPDKVQPPATASPSNINTSAASSGEPAPSGYKNHMHQFLQQEAQAKDRELGPSAARDFARSHHTVTLKDNRKGRPQAPLTRAPKVRVNCTTALNKTLTVLSTFTGGRLDCSEPSSYADDYINKRVAAHSTQPAQPPAKN